jgi:hypothetical protein
MSMSSRTCTCMGGAILGAMRGKELPLHALIGCWCRWIGTCNTLTQCCKAFHHRFRIMRRSTWLSMRLSGPRGGSGSRPVGLILGTKESREYQDEDRDSKYPNPMSGRSAREADAHPCGILAKEDAQAIGDWACFARVNHGKAKTEDPLVERGGRQHGTIPCRG